jgi:hypothetical protein
MRGKGISYDTGWVLRGQNSRELFEPAQVERDLTIIRDDPALHHRAHHGR